MRKKVKWFILPVLFICLLMPHTVLAATSPSAASLIMYSFNKKAITVGESVTMTIRTNAATNNVWVSCDNTQYNAVYQTTNMGGLKEWTVNLTPKKTQVVFVYGNTTSSATGAVTRARNIKVNPVPVTIESLTIDKTSITEGEAATLTIRTNDKVATVWAFYDNQYIMAEYKSIDANNIKTWTLAAKPLASQTITVSANTSYSTTGMVQATQAITVNKAVVSITSVTADETDIATGESVEVTIKTNAEANYAWVECDGKIKNAKLESSRTNAKTWVVSVTPSKSQKITAFANWDSSDAGAASKTLQVYVSDDYVKINDTDVSYTGSSVSAGTRITLYVYTNTNVYSVWGSVNGKTEYFTKTNTRSNEYTWEYQYNPTSSEDITVYASSNSRYDRDASAKITVKVSDTAVFNSGISCSPSTTVSLGTRVGFSFSTSAAITSVSLHDNTNTSVDYYSDSTNATKNWILYAYVPSTAGSYTYTIRAYNNNTYISQSIIITVVN